MQNSTRHTIASLVRRTPLLMKGLYYAYRFIQPKYSLGVVGLVWNDAHEILLVEHVFHPKIPWGLPGGWIGWNEEPSVAVQRELSEELGLKTTVTRLVHVEKTQFNHLDIAFECIATNEIQQLSNELLAYRWFSVNNLPQLHKFHYQVIQTAYRRFEVAP